MKLYPHNQEAYDNAVRMFKKEKRVCIIHPTGTGKSVIIAEFVNKNPSKRHLLLAPGTHIFGEIQKHLSKVEISCSTYIGLKRNESFFGQNAFDYIYLDEFHRLGADVWGGAVERLLKLNPGAKVLGTSATPIRYLDDQRNMAIEIFNGRIAAQMSLVSAIEKRILPAPIYVSALYSVQDEYQRIRKRVLASSFKDKGNLIRSLDSKVIDWEKSSGLDTVITKHLHSERRRVIVFCKHYQHLQYTQKLLDPIFRRIYGSFKSLSLYSKNKVIENQKSLKIFKEENESSIVLYTIDKVNEGLHSKICNTVILLRDTISPTVFHQQIGRAFSIQPTSRPLILDLVNNFKSVPISPLRNDIDNVQNLITGDSRAGADEKKRETVDFFDETQDIRQIFESFDDEIDAWKKFYEQAKAYFNKHGHLYVSYAYKELEKWVRYQGRLYRAGQMGEQKASKLRAIGLVFDSKIDRHWMTSFYEVDDWVKKNGTLPTKPGDKRLYFWVVYQRQALNLGKLSREQVKLLRPLLFYITHQRVAERVGRLLKHFRVGNTSHASKAVEHDLHLIRVMHRKNKLSETVLRTLRDANVPIDESIMDCLWLANIEKVLVWYKRNGRMPTKFENVALARFCTRERKYLNAQHPYAKFIKLNTDAGNIYEKFKTALKAVSRPEWDSRYNELKSYAELHGRVIIKGCNVALLGWMASQKKLLIDGKLLPEKANKLLAIKEINWYSTRGKKIEK